MYTFIHLLDKQNKKGDRHQQGRDRLCLCERDRLTGQRSFANKFDSLLNQQQFNNTSQDHSAVRRFV